MLTLEKKRREKVKVYGTHSSYYGVISCGPKLINQEISCGSKLINMLLNSMMEKNNQKS